MFPDQGKGRSGQLEAVLDQMLHVALDVQVVGLVNAPGPFPGVARAVEQDAPNG